MAILDELTTGLDPQARRDTWELIEQIREDGVTIVLVTHFMEEAERLCDRLAVIDSGRVVADRQPAGLIAMVDRRADRHVPAAPAVRRRGAQGPAGGDQVSRTGEQVTVTGTGNLLHGDHHRPGRRDVVPTDLRIEQASLDDAFLALTGKKISA